MAATQDRIGVRLGFPGLGILAVVPWQCDSDRETTPKLIWHDVKPALADDFFAIARAITAAAKSVTPENP